MIRVLSPIAAILLAVAATVAYGWSYYYMLKGANFPVGPEGYCQNVTPLYNIDGPIIRAVFAPAHAIDRLHRPDNWEWPDMRLTLPEVPYVETHCCIGDGDSSRQCQGELAN